MNSATYTLTISAMDALVNANFSQRSTKKEDIESLFQIFEKNLMTNQFMYAAELASDPKNKTKLENIVKKWGKFNSKSCSKVKNLITDIQKRSGDLIKICAKNHIQTIDFHKFVRKFDGNIHEPSMALRKTAIIAAIEDSNVNMLNLLSELGAKFSKCIGEGLSPADKPSTQEGLSPLDIAIDKGNTELVKLLIQKGAKIDEIDLQGYSPLTHAIRNKDLKMIELLIGLKADVNKMDSNGETPLTYAVKIKEPKIIECLIRSGADVNKPNKQGLLPVNLTVVNHDEASLKLLKSYNADLNLTNEEGDTPLITAVGEDNLKGIEMLLNLGAEIEKPRSDGYTPLSMAITNESPAVRELLESRGADKRFTSNVLGVKFLGHIYGLEGSTTLTNNAGKTSSIALEGLPHTYSMKMLSRYLDDFFKLRGSSKLPFEEAAKKEIHEAFTNPYHNQSNESADHVIDKIKNGKPVVILGGTGGHAITMVIYKDQLVVCNRGEGNEDYTAVMVYDLPAEKLTEKLLQKLTKEYKFIHQFNDAIENLNLTHNKEKSYDLKDQKAGNCTVAGGKAAVGYLFGAYAEDAAGKDGIPGTEESRKKVVRESYKSFTSFTRRKAFEDALISSLPTDAPGLMAQVLEKAGKKGLYSEKLLNLYSKVIHEDESAKLLSLCKKFDVPVEEYRKLIDSCGGNINGLAAGTAKTPVIIAIEENNINMLKLLASMKADLNKCDGNGVSPVEYAIWSDSLEMVEILKANGADVNRADSNGSLPLNWAIESAQLTGRSGEEMVKKLISLGANVNQADKRGIMPLQAALGLGQVPLIGVLLDGGVHIEKPNSEGFTPLAYAISKEMTEAVKLLIKKGANQKFAKDFLNIKFLAQVWGLQGETFLTNPKGEKVVFGLEGHQRKYVAKTLKEYVADFFEQPESAQLSDTAKKDIEGAIEDCCFEDSNFENMLEKVRDGKPVIIVGGSTDHAIATVVYNNKIIVCNRGAGKLANTVTYFDMPADKVSAELIGKLSRLYHSPEAFNAMLDGLKLTAKGGFQQKDLTSGSCTAGNIKSAFAALFREYTKSNSKGYATYKALTRFIRKKSMEIFFESPVSREDPALSQAILAKAGKKGIAVE